ncbi:hypothetical protein E2C01_061872 [Portunus trituberculatus]|uniref:Uncharacterized protein n=1 Tax=Portunus trituberculatus TaxID=210409 RepID=A0A5B7HC61_PORTR|nr:hypothetical protein [Portunus trituberculatus]
MEWEVGGEANGSPLKECLCVPVCASSASLAVIEESSGYSALNDPKRRGLKMTCFLGFDVDMMVLIVAIRQPRASLYLSFVYPSPCS